MGGTARIWNASTGKCLHRFEQMGYVVALSPNLAWLAYESSHYSVIFREIEGRKYLHTFQGHNHFISSVAFSYDSTRLASSSFDDTVRIWDTSSGECLHTLEVGVELRHISFDLTGSYLHTERGTIDLSILSTLTMIPTTSEPQYHGLALSSDGLWITYNSKKLVWLPTEYRSSKLAASGDTICVGVGSDVWMFKVDGSSAF